MLHLLSFLLGAIVMDCLWAYKLKLIGRIQLIERIKRGWSSK